MHNASVATAASDVGLNGSSMSDDGAVGSGGGAMPSDGSSMSEDGSGGAMPPDFPYAALASWARSLVDIDYVLYLSWLVTPLCLAFILPVLFVLNLYISCLILYINQRHKARLLARLKEAFSARDVRKAGQEVVAVIWDAHGWLLHGYEVCGLENIPDDGPALIVYYHGALPIDYYYFVAKVLLERKRVIHSVVDNFLFKVPGFKIFMESFNCTPGTVQSCVQDLQKGNMLGLAPGGVYEAQFGDSTYKVMWKQRIGFARIVQQAQVPVIPMFTENIRESFRSFGLFRPFFLWLYNKTRLPLVPVWGGFPVKLRTHLGRPIAYDAALTPEQVRDKCRDSLQQLISSHQRKPASLLCALADRIRRKTD